MIISRIQKLLTTPSANINRREMMVWFGLSLAFATGYAYISVEKAFNSKYVIEHDARQVVVWLERYTDPDLFPNDIIADYYISVTPPGYKFLFRFAASLEIDPISLSKVLPVILGLATTAICFLLSIRLLPVPATAFLSALLLNHCIWTDDAILSATPRGFLYPLFLMFLYSLIRGGLPLTLFMIALQGLFYPSILFVALGVIILRLFRWKDGRLRLSCEGKDYVLCVGGLATAAIVIVPYAMASSHFGPVINASEALSLPDSLAGDRLTFLNENFWTIWLWGGQSGMLSRVVFPPAAIFSGLLLPFLFLFPNQFPLVRQTTAGIRLLPRILLAALFMFLAAHIFLFKLYLPNRYTIHTFPIILSLAAAITLTVVLDALLAWTICKDSLSIKWRQYVALVTATLAAAMLLLYPKLSNGFPYNSWKKGKETSLYEFLSQQPKDSIIASVSMEANNLPAFTKRSVLVGGHFANPYQPSYYLELSQRYSDLLDAQYSPDLRELQRFIEKYGVDFLVVERNAFTPKYVKKNKVIKRFQPAAANIATGIKKGLIPALLRIMHHCTAFETKRFVVVRADCIIGITQ
jgi:hypothetical protein